MSEQTETAIMVQDLPRRQSGLWLDASNMERTQVGCKVCHWFDAQPYEEARRLWLSHVHDPIDDIRQRVDEARKRDGGAKVLDYVTDVEWLLARLEENDSDPHA